MSSSKPPPKGSIFDRLTDTSQYTGTHQHRFDQSGKGRGLSGRDRIAKGGGTTDTPYDDGTPIRDLSQITRTNLRESSPIAPRPKSGKDISKPRPHKRCREQVCTNTCSPISKQGYCSYHMWHEKESAPFPSQTPSSPAPAAHGASTSSLCAVPSCGNDAKEHNLCAAHAVATCIIANCNDTVFRMGYCQDHFQQMSDIDHEHLSVNKNEQKSSPPPKTTATKSAADRTLSRLTDPKQYTGSHQHRFDETGKGVGLDGRDVVAKGAGTRAKYRGGDIKDISSVLRQ